MGGFFPLGPNAGSGGAVSSVFARVGAVVAQPGDYAGVVPAFPGGSSPGRFMGTVSGAAPTSGTYQTGDFVVDVNLLTAWVCTAGGTPGTWSQFVNSSGVASIVAGTNVTLGGTAQNPVINAAEAAVTIPTGYFAEVCPRWPAMQTATLASLSTGEISCWAISLIQGQVVSKIAFMSGNTAMVTPTHVWFALYDANFNALAATEDDTAGTIGGSWLTATPTFKSLPINFTYSAGAWHGTQGTATTYTVAASGLYYVACMVAAATVPTLTGSGASGNMAAIAPVASVQDTAHTALTTPQTSPAQLTNSGTATGTPYFCVG